MTPKELATQLNGREYGDEITKEEEKLARENNLVVVFGYSDDIAEFRGIISDEVGAYDGNSIKISKMGIMIPPDDDERYVLEKLLHFGIKRGIVGFIKQIFPTKHSTL